MATYTVSSGTLICTGTDITSAGILSALNSNGLGSGHFGQTSGNKDTYFFNAQIQIGSPSSSGSSSVWNCSDEIIKINASLFSLYGTVQMGSYPSNISTGGGSFIVTGTTNDTFRLYDNGIFRAYGSFVYAQNRIRMDNDTEFTIIDCDAELEDGVSVGERGSAFGARQQITYDRARIHHTGGVGIKLYSFNSGANAASYSLAGTRVEKCTYGFQLGNANNLSPILKDVQIDTCTNHIVPNLGDANVTFVNPDFTVLRGATASNVAINASDITTIAFRYNFKVQDASNVAIQNSKVYIVDQNNDVVVNAESTDAGGLINSHLFDYDGDICLRNSTFAGNTKTNREDHTRSVYKYGFLPKTDTVTIDQDTKDFVALLPDTNVTESNKATVDAYTDIDTSAKFYDRASSYLEDNFGTYLDFIVTRSGNQIELNNKTLVIDATASAVFDYSDPQITIKASTYTGGATATTGSVTTTNGTLLNGGTFDCDVNYQSGAGTTLTNVTVNGVLDFDTAGTYTLDGCTISEVTNSSGGSITINLTNGSTITTNTGPNITMNTPVTVSVNAKDSNNSTNIQGARVYLIAGAGGDLAEGTVILNADTNSSGIVEDASFNFTNNQPVVGRVRKGTASTYYKTASLSGTITSAGLSITSFMSKDE